MSSSKLPAGMPEAYWETHFRLAEDVDEWPQEFAIITGYATTGEKWSDAENEAADRALHAELCKHSQLVDGSRAIRRPRAMRNLGGLSLFRSTPLARSASATARMPSISSARTFSR